MKGMKSIVIRDFFVHNKFCLELACFQNVICSSHMLPTELQIMSYSVHQLSLHQNLITERQVTYHQNLLQQIVYVITHVCLKQQNRIRSKVVINMNICIGHLTNCATEHFLFCSQIILATYTFCHRHLSKATKQNQINTFQGVVTGMFAMLLEYISICIHHPCQSHKLPNDKKIHFLHHITPP